MRVQTARVSMTPCVSRSRAAQRCSSKGNRIPLSRPIIDSGNVSVISLQRSRNISCNGLFGLGAPELAVIVGVVALVYGTYSFFLWVGTCDSSGSDLWWTVLFDWKEACGSLERFCQVLSVCLSVWELSVACQLSTETGTNQSRIPLQGPASSRK